MARTPDPQPSRSEPSGSSPKALRIGLFLAGRPLEERLVRRPQDVHIGPAQGNTIIIPPVRGLPARFALFAKKAGGAYELCFTAKMSGQLIQGDESVTLAQLIDDGAEQRGEVFRVPLDAEARGEVRLGDLKVLFQFITPPPLPPRPQLPLSLRQSLIYSFDRRLLQIAAGSFVVHFAFVVYLRAMERPRQPDIEELPDRFVKMLVPKKVEPPRPVEAKKLEPKKVEPKPDEQKKPTTASSEHTPPKKVEDPEAAARAAAEQKARMERAVAQMGVLKMLTAKGPGGALADALKNGAGDGDPDKVFREVGGVGPVTGEAGLGSARGGEGTGESKSGGSLVATGPSEGIGTGEKSEKKVHAVVQESAPPHALHDLQSQGRCAFVHDSEAGLRVHVEVRTAGPSAWALLIAPAKTARVSPADVESIPFPHDDAPPARAPQVTAAYAVSTAVISSSTETPPRRSLQTPWPAATI